MARFANVSMLQLEGECKAKRAVLLCIVLLISAALPANRIILQDWRRPQVGGPCGTGIPVSLDSQTSLAPATDD